MNTPVAPRRSALAFDRPVFALWTFAILAALDVVLYLGGPRMFGAFARGEAVVLLHVALASVVAFFMFGLDKRRSKLQGRRVAESTLLGLAFLGGAPGAMAAMSVFRHKTQKAVFKFGVPVALFAHVVIVGWSLLS